MSGGVKVAHTFQAVAGIRKPPAAVSRVTAKGNRVILDDEGCDSFIENKATGKKIPLYLVNGIYEMEVEIQKPPFTRPAKARTAIPQVIESSRKL